MNTSVFHQTNIFCLYHRLLKRYFFNTFYYFYVERLDLICTLLCVHLFVCRKLIDYIICFPGMYNIYLLFYFMLLLFFYFLVLIIIVLVVFWCVFQLIFDVIVMGNPKHMFSLWCLNLCEESAGGICFFRNCALRAFGNRKSFATRRPHLALEFSMQFSFIEVWRWAELVRLSPAFAQHNRSFFPPGRRILLVRRQASGNDGVSLVPVVQCVRVV